MKHPPRRAERSPAKLARRVLLGLATLGALATYGACGGDDDDGEALGPGDVVWSAEVSTLVIASAGGGFLPTPPNSECTIGSAEYTLRVAELRLDAWVCEDDGGGPLQKTARTRAITATELLELTPSLEKLEIVEEAACGADKPALTLHLTTGAGTREYRDSFYGCVPDPRPAVDTSALEEVFSRLAELSRA